MGVDGAVFEEDGFFCFFLHGRVFQCYVCAVALLNGGLSFCYDGGRLVWGCGNNVNSVY